MRHFTKFTNSAINGSTKFTVMSLFQAEPGPKRPRGRPKGSKTKPAEPVSIINLISLHYLMLWSQIKVPPYDVKYLQTPAHLGIVRAPDHFHHVFLQRVLVVGAPAGVCDWNISRCLARCIQRPVCVFLNRTAAGRCPDDITRIAQSAAKHTIRLYLSSWHIKSFDTTLDSGVVD